LLPFDFLLFLESKPEQATVEHDGIKFPISGDERMAGKFDLRLPHDNPLLSDDSPLFEMRDDLIKCLESNSFVAFPMLLGSSGVGKTTVTFCLALVCWVIYIEASEDTPQDKSSYKMDVQSLQCLTSSSTTATAEDVMRRAQREILARCIVIAALKTKFSALSSYDALQFQLTPSMRVCYDRVMKELGCGYSAQASNIILGQINVLLDPSSTSRNHISIVLDEAHLLHGDKKLTHASGSFNVFQLFLLGAQPLAIAGLLSVGTNVGLEQAQKLVSAVAKMETEQQGFVFGKYPILEGYHPASKNKFTVFKSLSNCIEGYEDVDEATRMQLENCLRGRPRFTASFLTMFFYPEDSKAYHNSLQRKILATWDRFNTWWEENDSHSTIAELKRLVNNKNMSARTSNSSYYQTLVLLLSDAASNDIISSTGTVVCTKNIEIKSTRHYKTGYMISQNTRVYFEYDTSEHLLRSDIWRFLTISDKPSEVVHKLIIEAYQSLSLAANTSKGTSLDRLFIFKLLVETYHAPKKLMSIFQNDTLFKTRCFKDLSLKISKIVSGPGMLLGWAEAMLKGPNTMFFAVPVRNVAVMPEPNAGSDAILAAFDKHDTPVLISASSAWYQKGVTKLKVEKQLFKTLLINQFNNKALKNSPKLQETRKKFLIIVQKWQSINVLIELPQRAVPPVNNVLKANKIQYFVIDKRNACNVLGIPENMFTSD
jgi:hypothetical protein